MSTSFRHGVLPRHRFTGLLAAGLVLGLGGGLGATSPAAPPTESKSVPGPMTEERSPPRGEDQILSYRPALRGRAEREIPAGRASLIPALVHAVERLKPLAAAHPGHARAAAQPWEPTRCWEPSDEELLLSLAGDRIWRSLQLSPPGTLARMRAENPGFAVRELEYPHLEITCVEVAGTGPRYCALSPVARRLVLQDTTP